jgi:hypothetical protein
LINAYICILRTGKINPSLIVMKLIDDFYEVS